MKAERRHELQTNSLALWIRWKAPELWQKYGTYVLLAILAIAVIFVFVKRRWEAPKTALAQAYDKLGQARNAVEEFRLGGSPGDLKEAISLIQGASTMSDDPSFQAQANLSLGDAFWTMICVPQTPESTTRPVFAEIPREEMFKRAAESYTLAAKVLPGNPTVVAPAELGLAALEETQAFEMDRASNYKQPPQKNPHWARAREHYEAVVKMADAPAILQATAKSKIELLPQLQKPIWVSTRPATTLPATTQSTTQSTTIPTTATTKAGK